MTEDTGTTKRRRLAAAFGWFVLDVQPLRESRSLRWLLIGQTGAHLSRQSMFVVVPLQVYMLTESPFLVGAVGIVQAIPLVLFSFIGGVLADSKNRVRLLVSVQLTMAFICGLFALSAHWASIWLVFPLVMINAAMLGIESPTRSAIIPALVRPAILPASLALNTMLVRVAAIAGPAVSGIIVAEFGFVAAYLVAMVALVFGAIASGTMRMPSSYKIGTARLSFASAIEGFNFVRTREIPRQCLIVDFLAMSLAMPRAIFPVFGVVVLAGDATTVGFLHAAIGAGSLVGLLTGGWMGRIVHQGRAVVVTVMVWSVAIAAFGFSRTLWLAFLFLAIAGAADTVSAIMRTSIIQLQTPDSLRGRVSAFNTATFQSGPMVGDVRVGGLAQLINPTFSVVSGGILSGIACGAVMFSGRRELWRYRADTPQPATEAAPKPVEPAND